MGGHGGHNKYPECKHIPRSFPQEISAEEARGLPESENEKERVLPLFERKISDYKRMKLCSLQTNEMLKCRWERYVRNIEGMKHNPFKFPNLGDLHFHNGEIKFIPSMTLRNRPTFRMQMAMGPGVDQYGQIPTPNDMHVSISNITKRKPTEYSKANKK